MTIYSIYKITNTVNNKNYIGFTSLNPKKRLSLHFSNSNKSNTNSTIANAIRKYGNHNFRIDVVWQSTNKEAALNKEIEFISEYRNKNEAHYNISSGGEGGATGRTQPLAERNKRRKIMKEISNRPSVKNKKSATTTKMWKDGKFNSPRAYHWKVTYPDGTTEIILSLLNGCGDRKTYNYTYKRITKNKIIEIGPYKHCIIEKAS